MNKKITVLLITSAIIFSFAAPALAEFKIEEAKINIQFGNLPKTLNSFSIDPCVCSEAEKAANPTACAKKEQNQCVNIPWIAMYIGEAYRYGVVIGSVLSVIMMMIGGLMYILGGFNQTMITKARGFMTGGVIGIVLLLGSYIMLNMVNPNLVKLKPLQVEVAKEETITNVTFCSQLDLTKYTVSGDKSCGATATFKSKSTDVKDEGTCLGDICANNLEKCLPAVSTSTNKYECKKIIVWGQIMDPQNRYLDHVWLYSVQGTKVGDLIFEKSIGKGKTLYSIDYNELSKDQQIKLNNLQEAILKIELNDTGTEKSTMVYGDAAGGFMADNFMTMTSDDEYYVGLQAGSSGASDNYVGLWIEPKCGSLCGAAINKTPGQPPGKDKWMYSGGCAYFSAGKMLTNGIRIDIDANNFREDSDISCDLVNQIATVVKKGIGEPCSSEDQCKSNDCESEKGIGKCECNEDTDCGSGETCKTSTATWNICVTK